MRKAKFINSRRTFLGAGLAAATVAAVSCARRDAAPPWRFFTAAEARTVDAICEGIIPADQDPGAHEACAVNYIDLQLTRSFRRHQSLYRQGIAAIDAACRKKFNKPFVEVTIDQKNEVLLEAEENSKEFFDLIVTHTRQGFYGDPRHGGNRNRASWKMVGLPFPQIRGRQHYDGPKAG